MFQMLYEPNVPTHAFNGPCRFFDFVLRKKKAIKFEKLLVSAPSF